MEGLQKDWEVIVKGVKTVTEKTEKIVERLTIQQESSKETPSKKRAKVMPGNTVLDIIKKSREGVDTATLKEDTGLDDPEIRRILFSLRKEGRINRVFTSAW